MTGTLWPGQLTNGNDCPRHVKAHVIHPIIKKLWAAVQHIVGAELSPIGKVVECHDVEMCCADDNLTKVPARRVSKNGQYG